MQKFDNIPAEMTLRDSRPVILERDEVLMTNFAGDCFPANSQDGMLCFRTDETKLYLKSKDNWLPLIDLNAMGLAVDVLEKKMSAEIARLQNALDVSQQKIAALTQDINYLKSHKPNLLANEVDGVSISTPEMSDELAFVGGQFTNRRRFISDTAPASPREGDWWIKIE